ncbi:tRNA (adenine(22)-N(1))-methyltransferase [Cohnella silvisoli]|uniref:Class I SAM-dependent methyltransferase n=1 Tax=Cohnella silvisoli TaxID=2873699 RepID=A0ABV1L009_9BACL|nr:class I SAM-dependent methyltransferase [Cohnella silvisoli]MCD9024473.1 class I SAM-dependent methyltransferase [Cohnella silvisoli]
MKDIESNGAGLKLSRRLSALAEWVPQGARFADIGTDHALLPVFLAGSGKINYAVAGDVHDGPVEAAKRQVAEARLESVVAVRLGDGMSVLTPGEVDTVTIAGMGGSLMARILDQAGESLNGVNTLVLSPHVAEEMVRRWLAAHNYVLDQEMLLEEDGVIYTLMRAVLEPDPAEAKARHSRLYDEGALDPRLSRVSSVLLYEMGPLLLRNPTAVFHRKWEQEIAKRERVILQLSYSSDPGAKEKAREWEEDVREIREVLSCLPEAKRLSN